MPRLKDTIDLTYPLMIQKDQVGTTERSISLQYLAEGNGIYGDGGKREGFRAATEVAEKKGYTNQLLDFRVQLEHIRKQDRLSTEDLDTVSFFNLSSAVPFRTDAIQTLSEIVMAEAEKKYGSRASSMDMDGWLDADPSLTSALFKKYPKLMLVVVRTGCNSLGGVKLPVAFFRNPKALLSLAKGDALSVRYASKLAIKIDKNA